MKLKVRYFGMTTEWTGTDSEWVDVEGTTVDELKQALLKGIPQLETISFQIAVNQKIAEADQILSETDEIAVLPPFAGG